MAKKTIEMIVEKRLRWHKDEMAVLYSSSLFGVVLMVTGAGVYFYVIRMAIVEQLSLISIK
jgi:hypothetical protein